MRVAVIDDEIQFAKTLKLEVERICEKRNLKVSVEILDNPLDILDEAAVSYYDIILLDIEMPYVSGIDIANKINRFRKGFGSPYIIFVSSQEHLVFEALKEFPYTFIRKNELDSLEACIVHIYDVLGPEYTVKWGRESVVIKLKDLLYLEKHGNYVDFITANMIYQERTTIDIKYNDIEKYGFLKVHSGALVNVIHIVEYAPEWVQMSNNKKIPISRTYRKNVKDELRKWMVKI